jgi:hypothetical protein
MTRDEGFAVMDVSTSLCDDPKFRRLQRESPELVAVGFVAYVATMAESWKAGRRVSADDAWPAFVPFEQSAIDALIRVGLLDRRGLVSSKAWRGWYLPALDRRSKSRARWARYNANRDAEAAPPPRGSNAGTATSVPSVRPSVPPVPSVRPSAASARGKKDDGLTTPPTKEEVLLTLSERFKDGKLTQVDYERERRRVVAS